MKLEAKVQDVDSVVVEMTIRMTMGEWKSISGELRYVGGAQEALKNQIHSMYLAIKEVVEAKATLETPSTQ